jgi:hypothetical protein
MDRARAGRARHRILNPQLDDESLSESLDLLLDALEYGFTHSQI